MSSNLKVNTILPSAGSNIGIGTNGGELNVDGGCKVQVGTALTLGHSIGLQYATQNLHSTGFEINQINASGIITASSFSGSGANLTSLPAAQLTGALPAISGANLTNITSTTINNNADNRVITGSGSANTLNGESSLTFDGNDLVVSGANVSEIKIDSDGGGFTGTGGSAIVAKGYFDYSGSVTGLYTNNSGQGVIGTKTNQEFHFIINNTKKIVITQNGYLIPDTNNQDLGNSSKKWKDLYLSGNLKMASGQGIDFSADGNASGMSNELLDDYEEGSWTATTPHSSSNSGCRYVKVGNMCLITGSVGNISNSSSSILEISGLPFNQRNSGVSGQVPYLGALRGYNLGTNVGNGRPPTTVVIENSKIYIGTGQGNGGWDMLQYNELGSSSNAIQFNVCYQTA